MSVSLASFAGKLSTAPALSMALGCITAFTVMPKESKKLLAITQYFSAGLLTAAIGVELTPKLINADTGATGTVFVIVGFAAGPGLMHGLAALNPEGEEDEDTPENPRPCEDAPEDPLTQSLLPTEAPKETPPNGSIPWTKSVPIYVDSLMDGLLIGVCAAASEHAGYIMALATLLEMGFLGITFGMMLNGCGWKKWPGALVAPVILVLGSIAGAALSDSLACNGAVFNGIVAFGASALLFLVTHELLKEASEINAGEDWHLSIWIFIGFLFIIITVRVFPDS